MKRNLILFGVLVSLIVIIAMSNYLSANKSKPRLFGNIKREAITQLTISKYNQSEVLRKTSKGWITTSSGEYQADTLKIDEMIAAVEVQRKEEPVAKNPGRHVDLGVDSASATLVTIESEKGGLLSFYVGNMAQGFNGNYIRIKGQNEVFVSKGGFDRLFSSAPYFYRDKTLLRIAKEQVYDIQVSYLEGEQTKTFSAHFNAEGASWELVGPDKVKLDNSKVSDYIGRVTTLNVDDWYEAEATETGFDNPNYTFYLKRADGTSVTLIAGGERNGNYFVKVENDDNRYMVRKFRLESLRPSIEDLKSAETATEGSTPAVSMPAMGSGMGSN